MALVQDKKDEMKDDLVMRGKVRFAPTFIPRNTAGMDSYMEIPFKFRRGLDCVYLTELPDEPWAQSLKERVSRTDHVDFPTNRPVSINRGDDVEIFFNMGEVRYDYEVNRINVLEGGRVAATYYAWAHRPESTRKI